jgi:hypothetical protein
MCRSICLAAQYRTYLRWRAALTHFERAKAGLVCLVQVWPPRAETDLSDGIIRARTHAHFGEGSLRATRHGWPPHKQRRLKILRANPLSGQV